MEFLLSALGSVFFAASPHLYVVASLLLGKALISEEPLSSTTWVLLVPAYAVLFSVSGASLVLMLYVTVQARSIRATLAASEATTKRRMEEAPLPVEDGSTLNGAPAVGVHADMARAAAKSKRDLEILQQDMETKVVLAGQLGRLTGIIGRFQLVGVLLGGGIVNAFVASFLSSFAAETGGIFSSTAAAFFWALVHAAFLIFVVLSQLNKAFASDSGGGKATKED